MVKSTGKRGERATATRRMRAGGYDYHRVDGSVVFRKLRFDFVNSTGRVVDKSFKVVHRPTPTTPGMGGHGRANGHGASCDAEGDGQGDFGPYQWRFGLPPDGARYLYRLPEVLAAVWNSADLVICEGEKDADAVRAAWGVAATTHHQGSRGWNPEQAEWIARGRRLADRTVDPARFVLVADRDETGLVVAWRTYRLLLGAGVAPKSVRLMVPAVPRRNADLSDHLNAGLGPRDLVPLPKSRAKELAAEYVASGLGGGSGGRHAGSGPYAGRGANREWWNAGGPAWMKEMEQK